MNRNLTPIEKRRATMAEKYGPDFYKKNGKAGGEATKKKYGASYFAAIGKKGGDSLKRDRGVEFFRAIARKAKGRSSAGRKG